MLSSVSQALHQPLSKAMLSMNCSLPTFLLSSDRGLTACAVLNQESRLVTGPHYMLLPLSAFFTQVSCSSKWQGGIFQLLSGEII